MQKYRVAIVVGHEEKAKGTKAVPPINIHEYDYNKDLAFVVARYVKDAGAESMVFFRDQIGLAGCYEKVNAWAREAPSCCIELHFNAFNGTVQGTECLYDADPADSVELAREIQNSIVPMFRREGKQNHGIKLIQEGDRGHYNMKLCKVPSCIVEPFFGDNMKDSMLGAMLKFDYAKTLADACVRFIRTKEAKYIVS